MKKNIKIILIVAILILIAGGGGFYFYRKNTNAEKVQYTTVNLKRGDITYGISATGNLNDSLVINVGTQVSGIISQVFVDFNDHVRKGQIIALLDTVPLFTQVIDAEAALFKAKTTFTQQTREFGRYKQLLAKNSVDTSDYDVEHATYDAAKSAFKAAQADLERAKTNLDYATIRAPISGIVINRAVTDGQTVASSFNTPTLFSIGNDPHIMQVTASIDEADIGWLHPGQDVDFTVETYPGRVYTGKVFQVRLQPIMNQNVVTYSVMINVLNKDLTLLPGMTATLTVKVAVHKDVLVAPMSALLFNPNSTGNPVPSSDPDKQTIWIICDSASGNIAGNQCTDMSGTLMYCDTVKRLLSNGFMAEIEGAGLHEGMKIVTGIKKAQTQNLKSLLPTSQPKAGAQRSVGK
jgi:HlyD family secretion protein